MERLFCAFLNLTQCSLFKVLLWVKLYGVPPKLWALGLSHVANAFVKPLYMDKIT